jgi:hypothetical protein
MSVVPNYLKSEGFASHQDLGVFRHLVVPHLNGTANASAIKLSPTFAAGAAQKRTVVTENWSSLIRGRPSTALLIHHDQASVAEARTRRARVGLPAMPCRSRHPIGTALPRIYSSDFRETL